VEEHAHLPTAEPEAELGSAAAPQERPSAPSRIVGRIVDPAVREDGRGDPVLVLHTAEARARVLQSQGPDLSGRGAAVRERLLAKARAAAAATRALPPEPSAAEWEAELAAASVEGESLDAEGTARGQISETRALRPRSEAPPASEPVFEALGEAADDLDLIGAPERRRAPRADSGTPRVSAAAALWLGTALGVAALAALFAVLIWFAPRPALQLGPAPSGASALDGARAPELQQPSEQGQNDSQEDEPEAVAPAPRRAKPAPLPVPRVQHEPRRQLVAPWRIADTGKDPELRRVRGNVGAGPFLTSLQSAGVSRAEAYRVYNAFRGVKNLNRTRPEDSFESLLDGKGHVLAFEYFTGEDEVYQAREGKEGRLAAKQLDLKIERQRAEGVIVVHGGFESSARKAGFEAGLSEVVNKALAGYTSTSDMKDGDVLALVAQEVTVLGQFDRYAGIEALEYRTRAAAPVRIYYHAVGRARAYVDGRGRTFGKSRWARPVAGAGVTSRFNPKRFHPILKRIKPHNGTDFGAVVGTPILAAAAGDVTFVGPAGPNGKMVRINHGGGYETGYSHLSRFAKGLSAGARVQQKQVIGYVGSTGRSTGPHLHFSAKRAGRFIDPESLNLDGLQRIPAPDRQTFAVLRQRYDQLLDTLAVSGAHAHETAPALAAASPPGAGSSSAGSVASATTSVASSAVASPSPAASVPAASVPAASTPPAISSVLDSEAPQDDPEPQDDAEE
jgi:hypothetical protein